MKKTEAQLGIQLDELQRAAARLQRRRTIWNAANIDRRIEELRGEYRQVHADWLAAKAQTRLEI
jgi:hypothetical protein